MRPNSIFKVDTDTKQQTRRLDYDVTLLGIVKDVDTSKVREMTKQKPSIRSTDTLKVFKEDLKDGSYDDNQR